MEGKRAASFQNEATGEGEEDSRTPGKAQAIWNVNLPDLSSQEFLQLGSSDRPSSGRGEVYDEILKLLTKSVIPKFTATLDQEKVSTGCALIVTLVIGPALRRRTLYHSYIQGLP
jgi:hypothetical protein